MRPVITRLTPTRGFSSFLHNALVVLLPLLLFVLVRLEFVVLAFLIVILAKWRMFFVRPRFWPANIRANAIDIIVGQSVILFMHQSGSMWAQVVWVVLYTVWLLRIKPQSSLFWVSLQAGIGQLAGLSAIYMAWPEAPLWLISLLVGSVCYLSARHFIDSFDEVYARLLSYVWAYTGAAVAWLTGHWLLYYQFIAQPTLLLTTIGYGLAALYYFKHDDRLSVALRRQFVFIMLAVVMLVITFSDWGDKVV